MNGKLSKKVNIIIKELSISLILNLGQAIPPGLHVRLNLQTGLREAKLLESNNPKPSSNDLVPVSSNNDEQERISKENLERAFANLDLSKDDVVTDKVSSK